MHACKTCGRFADGIDPAAQCRVGSSRCDGFGPPGRVARFGLPVCAADAGLSLCGCSTIPLRCCQAQRLGEYLAWELGFDHARATRAGLAQLAHRLADGARDGTRVLCGFERIRSWCGRMDGRGCAPLLLRVCNCNNSRGRRGFAVRPQCRLNRPCPIIVPVLLAAPHG